MNSEPHIDGSNEPLSPALEPEVAEIWVPTIDTDVSAETEAEIDPASIVEEAEQLLREGAPHDFDVLVIGGGPGGVTAALQTAQGGLKVGLIEEKVLGGVYLHDGCNSSKMLLSAVENPRFNSLFNEVSSQDLPIDLVALQNRIRHFAEQKRAHKQAELEEAGVEIVSGRARFVEEHSLEVENGSQNRRLTAVHVVIAVGGMAQRLEVEGNQLLGVVVSDQILAQSTVPPRLIVIGAGFVGIELASLFAALGSQVTILEPSEAILAGEDEEIQAAMQLGLRHEGIEVETSASVARIETEAGALRVVFDQEEQVRSFVADQVLLATARIGKLHDLGLAEAGIKVSNGKIEVGDDFQTSTSGIYAIGDCIRRDGWVNQAIRDGTEVASVISGISGATPSHFVPKCCFSSPQMASVGLTRRESLELGIEAGSYRTNFTFDRPIPLSSAQHESASNFTGWAKLVFEKNTTRLLGCHIFGSGAPALIGEAALAVRCGLTLHDLAATVQSHPTPSEILWWAALSALQKSIGERERPAEG